MNTRFVKNYQKIGISRLRRDGIEIIESGLNAIQAKKVIHDKIKRKGDKLLVGRRKYDLSKYEDVFVIGIGKASGTAAVELEKILGKRITEGLVIDVAYTKLKRLHNVVGTHPLPSLPNMRATGEIVAILKNASANDLVIAIISGGGSALLCWPYELPCREMTRITSSLVYQNASITEINTVRKHLSEIQGGQMVKLCYPAEIIGLIFSDIPGGNASMVASGPTYPDTTTVSQASKILKKYNVLASCKIKNCNLVETPKDEIIFKKVHNELIVNNQVAVKQMLKKTRKLGYKINHFSTEISGEARIVGPKLVKLVKPKEALIAAGETTVKVIGSGRGGRNMEMALSAINDLPNDAMMIAFATDGKDHEPVGGVIIDERTKKSIRECKIDPVKYLRNNDSYSFFKKVGGLIETGPTGCNVADLIVVLR